ncbi:MAG TPA: TIGR03790 family protein, partial [Methylophilaceae bacterium]|nr:TIGR03790 family protein [Methylophilaceae bacterium]
MRHFTGVILLGLLFCWSALAAAESLPPTGGLTPEMLGVVINDADPNSVEVGQYYIEARHIPAENVVHVDIPGKPHKISGEQFAALKAAVEGSLGPDVQAVVLVWTAPYAVECNSITSALTMGFDPAQCRNTCAVGRPSPYFNSKSRRPYSDYRMRISMLLPTESVSEAKALIRRGVISGFRQEPASAYLLITGDKARNSRARFFPRPMLIRNAELTIKPMRANSIEGKKDVMFYLTGLPVVPGLKTLEFLPGALADHLTSFGGDLLGQRQMSSLR